MKQYALLFACLFFLCVGSKAQEQPYPMDVARLLGLRFGA